MTFIGPLTLPIECVHCREAVIVQLSAAPAVADEARAPVESPEAAVPPLVSKQTWHCPYCGAANVGEFPNRVAWVTK